MATHPGGLITEVHPAVRTKRLVRRFGDRVVLKEIDLDIAPGEFTALLGRSGSGKSTLLRAVARLDHTVEGSGELTVPERVSLSFQDSRLLPWLRVLDNVILGLRGPAARERGLTALAEVGLAGRDRSWPHELSGGEQQRVAVARALCQRAKVLLADEPVSALDPAASEQVMNLLRSLADDDGLAVAAVLHQPDLARRFSDRILGLAGGSLVFDSPAAEVDDDTVAGLYRPALEALEAAEAARTKEFA